MRLISCGRCGVVIDQDRIPEPSVYRHDEGTVIHENACWDGDEYVPVIECPACSGEIFYSSGNSTYR
jgi:DNA-directed RNA polymerase subunit RPC12/RpoP